jgi:hypothetical protein
LTRANIEEDAPENKKSNLAQTPSIEKEESLKTVEDNNDLNHSNEIEIKSPKKTSRS